MPDLIAHGSLIVSLEGRSLELRAQAESSISERRTLVTSGASSDPARWERWSERYRAVITARDQDLELVALGREMFRWLDGRSGFLSRAIELVGRLATIEFRISSEDRRQRVRDFLTVPWELLADPRASGHLAVQAKTAFSPIRRIGAPKDISQPSPYRLNVVFMAASPRNFDPLDFEGEESRILRSTSKLGLDLFVEESGTLSLLCAAVTQRKPDVLHVSCHGLLEPEPCLVLEDEAGNAAPANAADLAMNFGNDAVRLFFLSACESARADPMLTSLAMSLVGSGASAVAGWASLIPDQEAALFSASFYGHLAAGETVERALALARLALFEQEPGSRGWHLVRLYLASNGGGVLATADGPSRRRGAGGSMKVFLDTERMQIPVAEEQEFVGRRRQIQEILREFRTPSSLRHTGVVVQAPGRQGKSSLAARVAHRLEHSHETVVVFGRYDARSILAEIRDRAGSWQVSQIAARWLPIVDAQPSLLHVALMQILDRPCSRDHKNTGEKCGANVASRPLLLVLDDFEQALEPSAGGPHRVKPELIVPLRAVLTAFERTTGESRLLITCRYRFTLPMSEASDAADLATRLLLVPLPAMDELGAGKQAAAKLAAHIATGAITELQRLEELSQRSGAICATAQGNPGLQDLLWSMCLEDPSRCDDCMKQMHEYLALGVMPDNASASAFLKGLAIREVLDSLTASQRELLRRATLFELPVPLVVLAALSTQEGQAGPMGDVDRLAALSLCEVYEDSYDPSRLAIGVNALVNPLAGKLTDQEKEVLAGKACGPLLEEWGGVVGSDWRRHSLDHELTRLGLLGSNSAAVASAAADTLRYLAERFEYRKASQWALQAIELIDAHAEAVPIDLLRTAAERCEQVGDARNAESLIHRAVELVEQAVQHGSSEDRECRAATLVTYGRALMHRGQPNEALTRFQAARELLPQGRERTAVLGEIARIQRSKGELDAALELYREQQTIFEAIGDENSFAIALGDMARILRERGDYQSAAKMYRQKLEIVERCGDIRSRAVCLGDIARIHADEGRGKEALAIHQEELKVYEELGDKHAWAVTLGDIARIRSHNGELNEALGLHQQELAVHDMLGDKRSRAMTLGEIAEIHRTKGDTHAALRMFQEQAKLLEELGEKRAWAMALGDIARIHQRNGDGDAALRLYLEELSVYEALEDPRSRAAALGYIARLRSEKGEIEAALATHEELIKVFDSLNDRRSRGVTLGDIARIRAEQGDVQSALQLHEERLTIHREMSYKSGVAAALLDLAQLEVQHEAFDAAFEHLAESYKLYEELEELDGFSIASITLGQLLCEGGEREEGLLFLRQALEGFEKLGLAREIEEARAMIGRYEASVGEPPPSQSQSTDEAGK